MHDRVIDETKKYITNIMDEGIDQGNNLEYLDKLIDIQKDAYKIKCMKKEEEDMYGNYPSHNYGRYGMDDHYGRYDDSYGRRERDSRGRYRGHDHIDKMYDYYGRYMEGRERYGANEDTNKSYHYMIEALEDFIKVLHEEASNEQQRQMLRDTLQRSMM